MSAIAQNPVIAVVAIVCVTILLIVVVLLGRRIEVRLGSVHAQLTPNGGTSVRDAIDRLEEKADSIDEKADRAVMRAQDAATEAHFAARHAASALERIERIEQNAPQAIAVALAPPTIPQETA